MKSTRIFLGILILFAMVHSTSVASYQFRSQSYSLGREYHPIYLIDMNGDGTDEVLAGNWNTDRVEIWSFDVGGDSLRLVDEIQVADDIHDIVAADFDHDGDIDVAVGLRWDGLYTCLNAGGTWIVNHLDNVYSCQVLAADFNCDGNVDLYDGIDWDFIKMFYGDGVGGFALGPAPSPEQPNGIGCALNVVDFNGDSRPDLLGETGHYYIGNYFRAYPNYGTPGTIAWGASVGPPGLLDPHVGAHPYSAGDLDENGYMDAVALIAPSWLGVWWGNGLGDSLYWTLDTVGQVPGDPMSGWSSTFVRDLDWDGHLDVLVGGGGSFDDLHLYLGDGHGGFVHEAVGLGHGFGYTKGLKAGDVNGDGFEDVVGVRLDEGAWNGFEVLLRVPCTLTLSPAEVATYYPCGDSYSLELGVEGVSDLGAFEICTGYNSALAQLAGFTPDMGFLESTGRDFYALDPVACASTCQASGKRIGVWSLGGGAGPSGDGALGRLAFFRESGVAASDSVCLADWELVDTQVPPGEIDVAEATGASIAHRSFCYGDFNDDFEITVTDIMYVAGRWGCCEGEACYADTFDVNLIEPGNYCMSAPDSCIDIVDIQEVAARWGLGCPGAVHGPHFAELLDQKLRVSPDTLTVIADGRETATLDVVVDDAYDLGALEMTVRFDPSVIQVENVVVGDFLASTGRSVYALGPQIDNERGEVKFGAWTTGETPGPEGSGVIAHLVLAGASQEGETTVEVTKATLAYTHGWPQMVSEVESGVVRTVLSTSVSEPGAAVPRSYALFQNVPNPFNPRTEIRYSVPVGGPVKVAIYDVAGREVAVVANGPHEAGNFTAVWDGVDSRDAGVVSGVYFVRMEAGDFTATRKTVLLR